jgi:hypothetical protein
MTHRRTLDPRSCASPVARARSVFGALLVTLLLGAGVATATAGSVSFVADGSGTVIGVPTADPTVYTVSLIASGQSTPLGSFRAQAHHFTDVKTGALLDGVLTRDFGSGDRLFGTYEGNEAPTTSPDIFTVAGTIRFTDGTGRLVGASGKALFEGELHIIGISPSGIVRETVTLRLQGRLGF